MRDYTFEGLHAHRYHTTRLLTPSQERIFMLLAKREIVRRQEIYNALWGLLPYADFPAPSIAEKTVHVQICRMRRKLGRFGITIEPVWGEGGYRIPERRRAKLLGMAL